MERRIARYAVIPLLLLTSMLACPSPGRAEIELVSDNSRMTTEFAIPTIRQVYVVTEKHPLSGECVQLPRRFGSRLEAFEYRESLRDGAWVVWRYVGRDEPLRSARFSSRAAAEQFVRGEGPARRGVLGMVLLTEETRILPARVTLETVYTR